MENEEVKTEEVKESEKLPEIKNEEQNSIFGIKADKNIHFEMDKSKSVSEQAKDLVNLAATAKAVQDEELVEDITELKKTEIKTSAETQVKQEQIKSKESETELQKANYGVYSGIADLIGLKKPLPNGMLKALMVILMPLLIIYYVVVGLVTGIINVTMDCVNAIVMRFAEFTKPAKKVIIFVLILAVAAAILLTIRYFLAKYGII